MRGVQRETRRCRLGRARRHRQARCAPASTRSRSAARWIVARWGEDPRAVLAGAGPFLELAGIVCGGAELGRAALAAARKLAAGEGDAEFLRAKIATARHFADHGLTKAPGLRDTVVAGAASVLALAEAQF